jgi:two-component system NtrC family sensor kinase
MTQPTVQPASARHSVLLGLWMAVAIGAVTALAYWDEERESEAALSDFAREQATLAHGISIAFMGAPVTGEPMERASLEALHSLAALDDAHGLRMFLAMPRHPGITGTDGRVFRSQPIERAVAQRQSVVRLSRNEAAALGLGRRIAMAGIFAIPARPPGWAAVAVATAAVERDREVRARWRLVITVALVCSLVLMFGGLALRRQRKQLELARELSLAAMAKERDDRLLRADKLATLGALATGVAHEVSTPLGVIIGRAEQLLARVDDERAKRAVQAIIDQAHRINQVVRGILGLARGLTPTMEHVDPAAVARAACDLVQHRFAGAGVALMLELDSDLPQVACEPHLFEHVLVNLLLNACDASQPGALVRLEVGADKERVAFVVLDNGSGISSLAAARATEPFFTTKPEGKGTGLGLAIANEIVKHHQGSLTIGPRVDSPAQQPGTRAAVELPYVR